MSNPKPMRKQRQNGPLEAFGRGFILDTSQKMTVFRTLYRQVIDSDWNLFGNIHKMLSLQG